MRYQRSAEPLDDLMQVASLALVKAVDRFDATNGAAFSSYAVPTIAGELKRYFRDRTWTVRPPRELQELTLRVETATTELGLQLDRSPTVRELAEWLDVDDERILEALQARSARGALSFEAPARDQDDERHTLQDTLASADDDYERAETRVVVDGLTTGLSARSREILRLRFDEDMTQAQIGERLAISQMQVSRLLRQALDQLRVLAGQDDAPGIDAACEPSPQLVAG